MAHYLYVLQSVTLNQLESRMKTPLDVYNQVSFLSFPLFFIPSMTFQSFQRSTFRPLIPVLLQEQRDALHKLRDSAFDVESENLSHERRRSLCAKEFKKLGFSVSVSCCGLSCSVAASFPVSSEVILSSLSEQQQSRSGFGPNTSWSFSLGHHVLLCHAIYWSLQEGEQHLSAQ